MSNRRLCTESRTERAREITKPACLLIENLPGEILSMIFKHLSPEVNLSILPLVCRRWAEIQTNRQFFTDITFSNTEPSTEVCAFITSRARFLRSVTLIHRADADAILDVIDDSCQLESIKVVDREAFCSEGVGELEVIYPGVYGRKMQDTSVEHIRVSCGSSDQVVRTLCVLNKLSLKTLIVDGREFTDDTLQKISECREMTTLFLRHLRGVSDDGIAHLRGLHNLRSLLLSYCNVSEAAWRALLTTQNFPQLEVVKIIGCSCNNLSMLQILSNGFPHNVRLGGIKYKLGRELKDFVALRTTSGRYEIHCL